MKYNWYSYLNKVHHENELVRQIKYEYGPDVKFVIGDWSNKGKLKCISTPNLGLKRKLAEHFDVYLIDEYRTSKIHNVHDVECNNLIVECKQTEISRQTAGLIDGKRTKKKHHRKNRGVKEKEAEKNRKSKFPRTVNRPEKKVDQKNQHSDNSKDENKTTNKKSYKSLHAVLTYKIVKGKSGAVKTCGGCINRDKNSVRAATPRKHGKNSKIAVVYGKSTGSL
jgi:hypothetical protein